MQDTAPHSAIYYLLLTLLVVCMHSSSQLLFKAGSRSIETRDLLNTFLMNWPIILGYVISFTASLVSLSIYKHVPLTTVFPTLILIHVFVLLGACYFFNETISLMKMIGMGLVFSGICFIWRG